MNRSAQGRRAEEFAAEYLRRSGYRIVGRNVRARFGEIDLVAQDGPVFCFVEIKARRGLAFGFPEEAVTAVKRWRLRRLAAWYLQSKPQHAGSPVRFDVVSVLLGEDGRPARMRLIKGAFEAA